MLSSRFHRFFLKNVDTQDINTRILRINSATNPIPQHLHHGSAISPHYGTQAYTISGGSNHFPTAPPSPLLYKTEITHAPYSPRPITDIKSTFVDNFFNSIRQPYQYEPVGVINKSVKNPFTALNTGETPEVFLKTRQPYTAFQKTSQSFGSLQQPILTNPTYGLLDNPNFLSKVNPSFNDFNSLRRAKSIAFNSTALHWSTNQNKHVQINRVGSQFFVTFQIDSIVSGQSWTIQFASTNFVSFIITWNRIKILECQIKLPYTLCFRHSVQNSMTI